MIGRRERVLKATILDHIETGCPVGSRSLVEQYKLNVSSATIRNDLKFLEEAGYLTHIHTSSGRIPTDKGYRYYVDALMTRPTEKQSIGSLSLICGDLKSAYAEIAKLLSDELPYAALVLPSSYLSQVLKVIRMIVVSLDQVLVVVLHSVGLNEEFMLRFKHSFTQSDIDRLSRILTDQLKGRSLFDITLEDSEKIGVDFPELKVLIREFVIGLNRILKRRQLTPKLYSAGVSKLLNFPEFQDMRIAQSVLRSIEDAQSLLNLIEQNDPFSVKAYIGSEMNSDAFGSCAFITAPIRKCNQWIGSIGVLGPKRLMYRHVMSYIGHLSKRFSAWLENCPEENLKEEEGDFYVRGS